MEKENDLLQFSIICNEYEKRELTINELKFLYGLKDDVNSFLIKRDPKLVEILKSRDIKDDFAKIFRCTKEEISFDINELGKKEIKCFIGDINLNNHKPL